MQSRQCIEHLWHVLAILSKSPCGDSIVDDEGKMFDTCVMKEKEGTDKDSLQKLTLSRCNKKPRQRSRQFKNWSLPEKLKLQEHCLKLLSTSSDSLKQHIDELSRS